MPVPSLEDRFRAIEDRLAIYTLIASHPPSADTAAANYTREVYVEAGVFDRGPKLEGAYGVDAIASFTLKPEHKEAIQGGLAHFAGLPLIDLRGDQAIVTSYLQILCLDRQGEPRELPNHGASQGYRIHRVQWQRLDQPSYFIGSQNNGNLLTFCALPHELNGICVADSVTNPMIEQHAHQISNLGAARPGKR